MRKQTDEFVIKEAENGNYEAIYELARRNLHGYVEIETNKEKAFELYKKVADESDIIDGKYMYAYCLYNGIGVTKDDKKAKDVFLYCAEKGDVAAKYMLGIMNYYGRGVEKDYEKAISALYNGLV